MLACHAGGPGSIPGRCNLLTIFGPCGIVSDQMYFSRSSLPSESMSPKNKKQKTYDIETQKVLEAPGIDPGTSRMLSERSTI